MRCPARKASSGCMPFSLARVFTFMPLCRAMVQSESPRRTICTCGRRAERPWPSTRAAASMTFSGSSVTALGTRRSFPTVSAPEGMSFSSRITLTVVWNFLAREASESPRLTV